MSNQPRRPDSQHTFNQTDYAKSMLNRNHTGYSRDNRKKSRGMLKFASLLIVLVLVALSGHVLWSKHVSAEVKTARQAQIEAAEDAKRKIAIFSTQLSALLVANPADTIGVATASTNDSVQSYGVGDPFDGASDGKLLTAADYLHHVEQGTASLNQDIDGQTAEYWLNIMLVNSDDNAWAELNEYLTHDDLENYAGTIGFNDYDPNINTFLPSDTARLLQQLYSGQLLNNADRSLMLDYLAQANYRTYIVPAVPKDDMVYHKIGLDDDEVNDAAIITNGQKYLVLAIFTNGNGSYNWDARAQLMQAITRDAIAAYL